MANEKKPVVKKELTPEEAAAKKAAAEKEVDELVQKGLKALDEFMSFDQEKMSAINEEALLTEPSWLVFKYMCHS